MTWRCQVYADRYVALSESLPLTITATPLEEEGGEEEGAAVAGAALQVGMDRLVVAGTGLADQRPNGDAAAGDAMMHGACWRVHGAGA